MGIVVTQQCHNALQVVFVSKSRYNEVVEKISLLKLLNKRRNGYTVTIQQCYNALPSAFVSMVTFIAPGFSRQRQTAKHSFRFCV